MLVLSIIPRLLFFIMNFVTLSVINGMIRILKSMKDSDLQRRDFSFSMTTVQALRWQRPLDGNAAAVAI